MLVLESAGNLWGSERVLLDMLASLDGMDVAVCCPPATPIVAELARLRIRVLETFIERLHEKSRFTRLAALLGLIRACAAHRPDLLYLNQAGCYRIARVAARLFRIPIVVHVRIFEDAEYLARLAPASHELHGIIAISQSIAEEIAKHPSLRGLPVHTIYDAYASPPGADAVPATSPPASSPQIACVGRIVPIKGQDVLLEALAWRQAQGLATRCAMVGSGEEYWAELQRKTAALGLTDSVAWLGFQREPLATLRQCSVLVVPSHREPLGRVIFEAWDTGCVPVAFAGSGGAAEVLAASQGGILYPSQTAEDLGHAIERALTLGTEERAEFIRRGKLWMNEHCAPASHATAMREVFLAVARGG
ncbi:MAG: glycosyltransferase [Verrucomicrobia bacterium]|nr:glycosyltransferase [Verrucomicrobiota bacterium]